LQASSRARLFEHRHPTSWDRARLSVVVPIGVIVAVAIICIVVAVFSSAQRADSVAVEHERQLLGSALNNQAEQVLREVKSVARLNFTSRYIREEFNPDWIRRYVGERLNRAFEHDVLMVIDADDRLLYSFSDPATKLGELKTTPSEVAPLLDYLHGRIPQPHGLIRLESDASGDQGAVLNSFQGQPAVIAAALVPLEGLARDDDTAAPALVSVKLIDGELLATPEA
jgi:sensor domain CHASE-containing protein